jgi:glutamate dehydrogenase
MLGSKTIRLMAAFDHRHLFIDPQPDPVVSYRERERLFSLPRSSWAEYDRDLISEGGGIYSRSAKRITLSREAQLALGTDTEAATPTEVIAIMLRAPVDVIWNGGIGTFVKGSGETQAEVGDRSNDEVRVNGSEVRAKIVVEGGNLGFTQRGRIEYALKGGRINADFIDNSGGVDCSDREVNLKILFGLAEQRGEIEPAERVELLAAEAENVVDLVAVDSLDQALMLTIEQAVSGDRIDAYEQLMVTLEEAGVLDRELEALPSTSEMVERVRSGAGMTRPELAILSAYAKRSLTEAILGSSLPDSTSLIPDLRRYFPGETGKRLGHLISEHPLRRELVATIVANEIVNRQGPTLADRLMARTGAIAADVVMAHRAALDLVGGLEQRGAVRDLLKSVAFGVWIDLLGAEERLVATLTRWYLRHEWTARGVEEKDEAFNQLESEVDQWGSPLQREARQRQIQQLESQGVPHRLARRAVMASDLVNAPDVLEVAGTIGRTTAEVGSLFRQIGETLGLDSLHDIVTSLKPTDPWRRWTQEMLEDDLIDLRRALAELVLARAGGSTATDALAGFLLEREASLTRIQELIDSLDVEGERQIAVMVIIRQIQDLVTAGSVGPGE